MPINKEETILVEVPRGISNPEYEVSHLIFPECLYGKEANIVFVKRDRDRFSDTEVFCKEKRGVFMREDYGSVGKIIYDEIRREYRFAPNKRVQFGALNLGAISLKLVELNDLLAEDTSL